MVIEAVDIERCIDAAKGLRYLEKMRIVHRDISARNLLCDSKYRVKVSDFGKG